MMRSTRYLHNTGSRKRLRVGERNMTDNPVNESRASVDESSQGTNSPETLASGELPLSGDVNQIANDEQVSYEQKGIFRLRKARKKAGFRFPKSQSQPEPIWRAGDGFSDDEAKPDFHFLMTGTHKQNRPRSLSGIGQLQLEIETSSQEKPHGSGTSCAKARGVSRYYMNNRRSPIKDVWPTKDNFVEELGARKPKHTVPRNEQTIPSTIIPQPSPEAQTREAIRYSPPRWRKRNHSDFENFGQPLRSSDIAVIRDSMPQSMPDSIIVQSRLEDHEEYEVEEYETELSYESASSVDNGHENYDVEFEENESASAHRGRESSVGDSAISIQEDEEHEPQKFRQDPYDILMSA